MSEHEREGLARLDSLQPRVEVDPGAAQAAIRRLRQARETTSQRAERALTSAGRLREAARPRRDEQAVVLALQARRCGTVAWRFSPRLSAP